MASQHLYLAHRALIDRTIAGVCRRHHLSPADAEDFAGTVRLHLLEDDCGVLRRFEGRSSLKTFLVSVVTHLYLDWRNAQWGKWRPSAEARKQGPLAIRLEQLVVRDKLTFDEACETLRTNFGVTESRASLEALAVRLPVRAGRQLVSEEVLDTIPTEESRADRLLSEKQAAGEARGIRMMLSAATHSLPAQDRLILEMRFTDGFTVADIARALHLEQKPLYRRMERLLLQLRAALEANGVSARAAAALLSEGAFDALDVRPEGAAPHPRVVPARKASAAGDRGGLS